MAILLNWENRVAADSILVYRDTVPFDKNSLPAVLAVLSGDATGYKDSGVVGGTEYFYRIVTKILSGDQMISEMVNLTPTAGGSSPSYATISLVSSGTPVPGYQITVPLPPTYSNGDLLMLCACGYRQDNLPATPTGWTRVHYLARGGSGGWWVAVWYRFADGTETDTYVGGDGDIGQMFAFSGVDQTTPIDATPAQWDASADGTIYTLPAVTTTMDGCAIFHVTGSGTDASSGTVNPWDNWTIPSGGAIYDTEVMDHVQPYSGGSGIGVAMWQMPTAGTTAAGSCTLYVSEYFRSSFGFALRPATL